MIPRYDNQPVPSMNTDDRRHRETTATWEDLHRMFSPAEARTRVPGTVGPLDRESLHQRNPKTPNASCAPKASDPGDLPS